MNTHRFAIAVSLALLANAPVGAARVWQPPPEPTGTTGATGPTGPTGPTSPTGAPPAAPTGEPAAQPPAPAPAPSAPAPPPAPTGEPATPPPPPQPSTLPAAPDEGGPREATITLKDGQRYTGVLIERNASALVLRIAGIDTAIPLSLVDRVEIQPPILERYRTMRASIDNNDTDRLLMLAEWLRGKQQWELALAEIDHILELQPESTEAKRLKLLVESQRDLAQKSSPPPVPGATGGPPALIPLDFPLVSDKDINLIKVFEVDLTDPPRMTVDRDTITRLMDEHANDPLIPKKPQDREAMYRTSPARLLDLMFRTQARNLYQNVKVQGEPRSMRIFRDDVHRTLIANFCATSRCHGGTQAGRLMLAARRPAAEATVYTNFLILDRFRLNDGTPLINYGEPAKSVLLQFALPRDLAAIKHPLVPGPGGRGDAWKPFFRSTDDRRYTDAIQWIDAMYKPHPEYPIEYRSPAPEAVAPKPGDAPVVR